MQNFISIKPSNSMHVFLTENSPPFAPPGAAAPGTRPSHWPARPPAPLDSRSHPPGPSESSAYVRKDNRWNSRNTAALYMRRPPGEPILRPTYSLTPGPQRPVRQFQRPAIPAIRFCEPLELPPEVFPRTSQISMLASCVKLGCLHFR